MADYRIINQKVRRYLFTKSEIDWLLQNDYLDFVPKNMNCSFSHVDCFSSIIVTDSSFH